MKNFLKKLIQMKYYLHAQELQEKHFPGYKQIKNIQKSIIIKAKKILEKDDIDWL